MFTCRAGNVVLLQEGRVPVSWLPERLIVCSAVKVTSGPRSVKQGPEMLFDWRLRSCKTQNKKEMLKYADSSRFRAEI